jgi:hypothetical protein
MSIAKTNSFYFLQLHHPVTYVYVLVSQVSFSLQVYIFEMDPAFPAHQTILNAAVTQRE